jgi:PAS domain S-box-containing protein
MIRPLSFTGLLMLALLAGPLAALADTLTVGVLAYRPVEEESARWQPLAEHLGKALQGRQVRLQALPPPDLNRALERNELDFVLTNPAHYIELRQRNTLTGVLASLVESAGDVPLAAFGGVILTLATRHDLNNLQDLKGRRVAFTSRSSFGGFQMQALELVRASVPLPEKAHSLETGMPQDRVVEAVLAGKADAGFVRTGVIEDMARQGRLQPASLKILNSRRLQGYPYAVSTTLYPEWPFIALPHVDERTSRRVASALLAIEPGTPLAKSLRLHGFSTAANYAPVEELMRELRLPPFDAPPRVTLADIWQRHRPSLIALAVMAVAVLSMTLLLAAGNRRLTRARREAEDYARRLQSSEERLQLAINAANDGIWDWDVVTNAVYFSPKWKEMLGYAEGELPNTFATFAENLHPVDKPAVLDVLDCYLKGEMPAYRVEFRMRHKDGSWRWILARGEALRDKDGQPYRMLGSHTDISEHKRAEEALRQAASVFANCQEGILITDADHRIIDVNPAFSRITGYQRDEALGRNPSILSSGRHDKAFYDEMWRALHEEGIWRGELWNRRKNGELYAELDRKSTRLNSSHNPASRMPSSA